MKGQRYNNSGCDFYFPGSTSGARCPLMAIEACYVFNGGVCCSSDCPGVLGAVIVDEHVLLIELSLQVTS